jgi:glucuronate isomerase
MIGTTDDPIDPLTAHAAMAADASLKIDILPTWRPDVLFKPERADFVDWIAQLGIAADLAIGDYAALLDALEKRLDDFAAHGCLSADHGIDHLQFCANGPAAEQLFARCLRGQQLSADEASAWRSALYVWLGRQYARRGWVMQLHIGAQRDNNSRMLERIGRNSGFDSIGDAAYAEPLARLLDTLDRDDSLPKTILHGLNPRDNEMLATMAGNFQRGTSGKIQFGSAWWFNDQADGIRRQLTSVAQMSLLARFVGMLTDSRSLLSFSRHEYFRRILCDLIGGWIEAGEAPADFDLLGGMVQDICGRNTVDYFGLNGTRA